MKKISKNLLVNNLFECGYYTLKAEDVSLVGISRSWWEQYRREIN